MLYKQKRKKLNDDLGEVIKLNWIIIWYIKPNYQITKYHNCIIPMRKFQNSMFDKRHVPMIFNH